MHPSEEILNDYVDGALSSAAHADVKRHLAACAECEATASELRQVVGTAAALPDLQPPAHVWPRLAARIAADALAAPGPRSADTEEAAVAQKGSHGTIWGRSPAWVLATAAMMILAFLTGQLVQHLRESRGTVAQSPQPSLTPVQNAAARGAGSPDDANIRERLLLVALGDHLERSQMVLVELANARTQGELDISTERQSADELVASNRLYRQTAGQVGETGIAGLLDDLERVLVEVARGPSQVSTEQLADIQQRIEAEGILFKVKIIGSEMRERGNSTSAGRKQPVS